MNKFFNRLLFLFRLHKSIPFALKFFFSKEVGWKKKVGFASVVVVYTLIPTDAIHDYLPLLGVVDDVAVAALILEFMRRNAPADVKDKYLD